MTEYRLIYNNDGGEPFIRFDPPGGMAHVYRSIDELKDTAVDTLCWSITSGDMVVTYPSKMAEIVQRRGTTGCAGHLCDMMDRGEDPLAKTIECAQRIGLQFFASVRMNDCHHKSNPAGPLASNFWRRHQHMRLWDVTDGDCYYNAALDYSHDEVRQRRLEVISELAHRYDVDGIELDMCRNPYFFLEREAESKQSILTEFLRAVRRCVDEAGAQRGRDIALMIHCPIDAALLQRRGMDVRTWMREKLAEVFAMAAWGKRTTYNDFHVEVEPWRSIAKDSRVAFRAGVESGVDHNAEHNHVTHATAEELRGMAQNLWAQGVEGLYLFNFPCLTSQFVRDPETFDRYQQLLTDLAEPDRLRRLDKTYTFYGDLPIELELYRPAEHHQSVAFTVREPGLIDDDGACEISFKLTGFPESDAVHYLINGRRVPPQTIQYEYGLKTSKLRSGLAIDSHQIVKFRPPAEWIRNDVNMLGFYLERGPWGEHTHMHVYDLEIRSIYPGA